MPELICPRPGIWADIHKTLTEARRSSGNPGIPDPPIPFILAGWVYSEDWQKRSRWQETMAWAERYGFQNLIPELESDDCYFG